MGSIRRSARLRVILTIAVLLIVAGAGVALAQGGEEPGGADPLTVEPGESWSEAPQRADDGPAVADLSEPCPPPTPDGYVLCQSRMTPEEIAEHGQAP